MGVVDVEAGDGVDGVVAGGDWEQAAATRTATRDREIVSFFTIQTPRLPECGAACSPVL